MNNQNEYEKKWQIGQDTFDLEDYVKNRKDSISVNEVKVVLIQLNNSIKKIFEKQNIHGYLEPKKILIFLTLDKCIIKLSNYSSNKFKIYKNYLNNSTLLSMAPEVLEKNKLFSFKSDIWSLGIIIYYMLFKEYPYNGNNKYQILKDILSNKKLKSIGDEELNDLLTKMLKVKENDRIIWDEYLNHPFFKTNIDFKYPKKCENDNYYLDTCNGNIYDKYKNNGQINYQTISIFGLSKDEKNIYVGLKKKIHDILDNIKKEIINIQKLMNETVLIKENNSIYQNDSNNGNEKYFNDILYLVREIINNINLIDLEISTKNERNKKELIKTQSSNQEKNNKDSIESNNNENKQLIYKKKNYGFENERNDCFMNASLQLLTHEESLIDNILKINESKINNNTPGKGKLIPEFKNLIGEINKNVKLINPRNIKSVMGLIDKKYNTKEQQDANEFINTLLMEIHDEINENNNSNPKNIPDNIEEKRPYLNFWNKFYKKNNSFIIDLFHGIFKDEIKCKEDHILNTKFRIYNMIELPIIEFISNKNIELNDILKQFLKKKDSDKKKFCSYCKKKKKYSRQTYIYSSPPLLLLFFNRVVDDKYYYNNIIYDEELKMKDCISEKENNYELIGLIEHIGNEKQGHYTAICKNNSSWYKYNDGHYYSIHNIQSNNTIILLYKKK